MLLGGTADGLGGLWVAPLLAAGALLLAAAVFTRVYAEGERASSAREARQGDEATTAAAIAAWRNTTSCPAVYTCWFLGHEQVLAKMSTKDPTLGSVRTSLHTFARAPTGEWEGAGFAPEAAFLEAAKAIPGVTTVETQTYTLMPC